MLFPLVTFNILNASQDYQLKPRRPRYQENSPDTPVRCWEARGAQSAHADIEGWVPKDLQVFSGKLLCYQLSMKKWTNLVQFLLKEIEEENFFFGAQVRTGAWDTQSSQRRHCSKEGMLNTGFYFYFCYQKKKKIGHKASCKRAFQKVVNFILCF